MKWSYEQAMKLLTTLQQTAKPITAIHESDSENFQVTIVGSVKLVKDWLYICGGDEPVLCDGIQVPPNLAIGFKLTPGVRFDYIQDEDLPRLFVYNKKTGDFVGLFLGAIPSSKNKPAPRRKGMKAA